MQIARIREENVGRYLRTRCRMIFKGGIYHVTQRAPGAESLFIQDSDYLKFISLLKTTAREFQICTFCFSLLVNHAHLLIQINDKNLSEAMKFLFGSYAIYFNKKYDRKGHVFCGPYRASVVDDDHYLMAACVYIHLNAFRAGLCDSALRYRWHSLNVYLEKTNRESFIDASKILLLLGPDIEQGRRKYRQLLQGAMDLKLVVDNSKDSLIEKAIKKGLRLVREILGCQESREGVTRAERVKQLIRDGYSLEEAASELGVSRATFFRARKKTA